MADLTDWIDAKFAGAMPWQRRFASAVESHPMAALTMGRGGGKSATIAALVSAVIDPAGPWHHDEAEVLVVAASHDQARVILDDTARMLTGAGHDLDDRRGWRRLATEQRAEIRHRGSGAHVRALGFSPRTAHGRRASLSILDEPAQYGPRGAEMWAAVDTGQGKRAELDKLIALGTRPADERHWFAALLSGSRPDVHVEMHAARPDDPELRMRTVERAIPSLRDPRFASLRAKCARELAAARSDAGALQSWRSLRLNLGVADTVQARVIDGDVWAACEVDADSAPPRNGPPIWGVDLGSTASMSAIAACWPSGRVEVLAALPSLPSLLARGTTDRVGTLYAEMAAAGELVTCGRSVCDVAELVRTAALRFGAPARVVSDRWRDGELRDALDGAGLPRCELILRGQGFRDGGDDMEAFRRQVTDGKVSPLRSLLLRSALAEARVATDPAGRAKLAKSSEGGRRQRARDDAAAAVILAIAEYERQRRAPRRSGPLLLGIA